MNSSGNKPQQYPAIDALRAMAALMVLIYHVIVLGWGGQTPLPRVFHFGWIGVDCFFVISGFVITLSALRLHDTHPQEYKRIFMIHRWARIAPLYFFTCAVFLLINGAGYFSVPFKRWFPDLLSHVLFIHNLFPSTSGSLNGPTWSLGLEMQFYVFVLLLAPFITRRNMVWVSIALIAGTWLYRYSMMNWVPMCYKDIHRLMHCTMQLPGVLDEFAWGILLAACVYHAPAWLRSFLRSSWINCLVWMLLFLGLFELAQHFFWPRSEFWNNASMVIFWRTLLSAAFACLLAAAITLPQSSRIMNAAFLPLNYLGKISYGIYLWHMMVLILIRDHMGWLGFQLLLATFLGTVLVSSFTWYFVEKPMGRWINQWARSKRTVVEKR